MWWSPGCRRWTILFTVDSTIAANSSDWNNFNRHFICEFNLAVNSTKEFNCFHNQLTDSGPNIHVMLLLLGLACHPVNSHYLNTSWPNESSAPHPRGSAKLTRGARGGQNRIGNCVSTILALERDTSDDLLRGVTSNLLFFYANSLRTGPWVGMTATLIHSFIHIWSVWMFFVLSSFEYFRAV